jgi:metal-responsive CopG/Arc/MetJ family transcriptional regulator
MKNNRLRAHVIVPEDLLREVDALVGQRKRSDFFVEAAREKVDRMKLRKAAHEFAGFLKDADTPHWETPEATSEWVRSLRRESDERAYSRREEP